MVHRLRSPEPKVAVHRTQAPNAVILQLAKDRWVFNLDEATALADNLIDAVEAQAQRATCTTPATTEGAQHR